MMVRVVPPVVMPAAAASAVMAVAVMMVAVVMMPRTKVPFDFFLQSLPSSFLSYCGFFIGMRLIHHR
jgi:hypothetical protein